MCFCLPQLLPLALGAGLLAWLVASGVLQILVWTAVAAVAAGVAARVAWTLIDNWRWNRELNRWNAFVAAEMAKSRQASERHHVDVTVVRAATPAVEGARRELPPGVRMLPTPRKQIRAEVER